MKRISISERSLEVERAPIASHKVRTIADPRKTTLLRQAGWFVSLWLGGVLTVGSVAMLLRLALHSH